MNDIISRQAAIDAVRKLGGALASMTTGGHETVLIDKALVQKELMMLPSAQKHGKWIDTGSGEECSACGEFQPGYDSGRYYCPNCGARMEDSDNDGGGT